MFQILVADDNANIRNLIATRLQEEGYKVFTAKDGQEALDIIDHEHIDLLVADIMMPNMDGYRLTEELRTSAYLLPILMITAKNQQNDKREGFRVDTDDYMVKPIDFEEMLWRVEALLRRVKANNEKRLVIGNVTLDYESLTVQVGGEEMLLPPKEFYLLFKLLSFPKRIFTRRELMDEIWGLDSESDERAVDTHIRRLRDKFGDVPDFTIVTIRGLGYRAEKCL